MDTLKKVCSLTNSKFKSKSNSNSISNAMIYEEVIFRKLKDFASVKWLSQVGRRDDDHWSGKNKQILNYTCFLSFLAGTIVFE